MFSDRIKKLWSRTREVFAYTAGCGCALGLKVLLTFLVNYAGISFWLAYLLTHSFLLFTSFFYHHCITFRKKFTSFPQACRDFGDFTATVILLKMLDYILVVAGREILVKYILPAEVSALTRELFSAGLIIAVSGSIFVLRFFIYQTLFKKPQREYYIGSQLRKVFLTHAAERSVACNAASGGAVTALLLSLLRQGKIQGALVAFSDFSRERKDIFFTGIARSEEDLMRAQGSIYSDFPYLTPEILKELKEFKGKIAVVGLPCQLRQIDGLCSRDPELAEKICLKIGLFCGHTSKPELLDLVLAKKGLKVSDIKSFRFSRGKWRGTAEAVLHTGETKQWPSGFYKLYQNLFIAAPRRCICCFDHFAENADISTGDVWMQKYRFADTKPSMTVVRTERGEALFASAVDANHITAAEKTPRDLYNANARSAILHKAIAAKARVFARYGITVPVPEGAGPSRWNEKLALRIIAAFFMKDPAAAVRMNRRWLKFCLYVVKGLTSF